MRGTRDRVWIGHLLVNAALGAGLGVLLATAFVAADLAGLGSLMGRSIGALPGFVLLASLFGTAFAFMAAGTAVMLVGPERDDDRPTPALVPVRARRSGR